ncbi:hypothetical protein [uncultured Pelagimonas sp.]|uniref:hypothetical protein n=1 Tax=uncultured Pelagimonas sp. TaxID=1618102 RepID=UPI00262E447B|nr:hypothetical protein [uncultured Pelagimonas sp.]
MEYLVKRPHEGDKWYNPGDIREANPQTVKHLVDRGVLVVKPADEDPVETVKQAVVKAADKKAKAKPENKAAQVPADKAEDGVGQAAKEADDQKTDALDAKD